jgi:hypothetical protein
MYFQGEQQKGSKNTAYKLLRIVEILPMKKVPKCYECITYVS